LTDDQCKNLRRFYQEENVFKLMRRKGVYPYEYMDSFGRFDETKLPPKEAFDSKLNISAISDQDYEHAQRAWDRITPEEAHLTMGDNHDVYSATDVLLLVDVFETSRDTCLTNYGLDPAHLYITWISMESSLKTYRYQA
jgi:hypothetical protein